MPSPALADTLSVLLPTAEQTLILRACLHSGETAHRAWRGWCAQVVDVKATVRDDRGAKQLLPLLFTALQRTEALDGGALQPYLRAAYLSEELRDGTYRRACRATLSALAAADLPVIALKGAALMDAFSADCGFRHSHDIDLLAPEEDAVRAAAALERVGFRRAGRYPQNGTLALAHSSGLPVEIHSRLFRLPCFQVPLSDLWKRSEVRTIEGVACRVLSPADALLHVCGQACCSDSRETLQWVCDAWCILSQQADLDWNVFLEAVRISRLSLPLSVLLRYLAGEIGASVPAAVLEHLDAAASGAPTIDREAALLGARAGRRGTFKSLLRHSRNWQARAAVLKWMLIPSPGYLRQTELADRPWLLPLYYGYRPLKYAVRRVLR